jgi:hypothetical protein
VFVLQTVVASANDRHDVVRSVGCARGAIAGKPAKTAWARGDVQFIGRGVPHESKNTSGKPTDFVIVSIR